MTVLDRLVLLFSQWQVPEAYWRPRLALRYRSPVLAEIDRLGGMLTVRHGYSRTMRGMIEALKMTTPEMEWLRQ